MQGETGQLYKTTFQHIYFSQGFAISKAFTQDGKDYNPPTHHGCLRSGYFCFKNIKESPKEIIAYIGIKLYIFRTLRYLTDFYKGVEIDEK